VGGETRALKALEALWALRGEQFSAFSAFSASSASAVGTLNALSRGAELPREVTVVRIPTLSFIIAALLAAPGASAQFTGLVTPPPRPAAPVEMIAAAGAVDADTTAAARMTDMKAWVDSAAVAVAAQAPQDTATPPPVVIETPAAAEPAPQQEVTAFQEGAPAPNTATVLPALLLLGAGLVAGGAALRRR
jgi:hypothetical protein